MSSHKEDIFSLKQEAKPVQFEQSREDTSWRSKQIGSMPSIKTDEAAIIDGLFTVREGIILNERWSNSYILSARVNAISEEFVSCETIINKEQKETQIRNYPSKLFEHIPFLAIGKTIKIKINEKSGSFRLDVIDGSNTGIEREFENLSNWDSLQNFKMDNPKEIDAKSNI